MPKLQAPPPPSSRMELGRDDAVALLAYSMAAADGDIAAGEEAAIQERLLQRGIRFSPGRREALRQMASRAHHEVSTLLRPVCQALPEEHQRVDAMRLALDVVWADHAFEASEMAQVLELADELGIDRGQASRLIDEHTT